MEAPVWICDFEGRLTFVNTRARKLLGLGEADWAGRFCHDVVRGTDVAGKPHCRPGCRSLHCARNGLPVAPDDMWVSGACNRAASEGVRVKTISAIVPGVRPADRRLVHIALEMPEGGSPRAYLDRVAGRTPRDSSAEPSNITGGGGLTQREEQILGLLAEDRNLKEIASELGISYATVRTHVQHVLQKLGAHSILEATVRYLLQRL